MVPSLERLHIVCIPYPSQGHINPMFKLAKLLYSRGFWITFVNTEFNHQRLLRSSGQDSLKGFDGFRFESIPDGLPPSNVDATQDITNLCDSTSKHCLAPFKALLEKLNTSLDVPLVSFIVSDGVMSFALDAAQDFGIREVVFWTSSACGFMGYFHYADLIERGLIPLKDNDDLTNGYLNTVVDWIPGLEGARLKDLPSFLRTTDHHDIMMNFVKEEAQRVKKASALVLNTFDGLEQTVLDALRTMLPMVDMIGPLCIQTDQLSDEKLQPIGSSLWKEEGGWLEWLDTKESASIVYINYGSITVMSPEQMEEFAWGLANTSCPFLWVMRPDLVTGKSAVLPRGFLDATRDRSLILSWVPQELILSHPSISVFLTHSGWNSMIESISNGVPTICWPFFAEQQTNCWFSCNKWNIGVEIDHDVKRDEVEHLVNEMVRGEMGVKFRSQAEVWKQAVVTATSPSGSSSLNFEKLVTEVIGATREGPVRVSLGAIATQCEVQRHLS